MASWIYCSFQTLKKSRIAHIRSGWVGGRWGWVLVLTRVTRASYEPDQCPKGPDHNTYPLYDEGDVVSSFTYIWPNYHPQKPSSPWTNLYASHGTTNMPLIKAAPTIDCCFVCVKRKCVSAPILLYSAKFWQGKLW